MIKIVVHKNFTELLVKEVQYMLNKCDISVTIQKINYLYLIETDGVLRDIWRRLGGKWRCRWGDSWQVE